MTDNPVFNIYCDESCHLENDGQKAMVLGAVSAPASETSTLAKQFRKLKSDHGLSSKFELKWSKVSPGQLDYYQAVLKWFWENEHLSFRALIVPDKQSLDHELFDQSHDDFYYKMYFDMLKVIIDPTLCYCIYLDIKDTRGHRKVEKLWNVLCNTHYDFSRNILKRVQQVRSEEVELVQLADFLIGIISYVNRDLEASRAKLILIRQLQAYSGYSLRKTTLLKERKLNLFRWHAKEVT
jgi:hypothetical protein